MKDQEPQFTLNWKTFSSNFLVGFHESLCREDLVDVTLAAEGQLVKAHRIVLSVCSSYFRKMFTQMPSSQHAFVFLKDVSHAVLKGLIQFMYCGEVTLKEDALEEFIKTAEALQIKGLTETEEPATPASSQTPMAVSSDQHNISHTSYKSESEDSSHDKPAPIVYQRRRNITPITEPAVKRAKKSDPDEVSIPTSPHQTMTTIETESNADENEPYDLTMKSLPIKPESDYGEDEVDVETVYQDTRYGEDDPGNIEFDVSYSTENDDGDAEPPEAEPHAATVDQPPNEAEGIVSYVAGHRKSTKLKFDGFTFTRNKVQGVRTYWSCARAGLHRCKARIVTLTNGDTHTVIVKSAVHNHEPF